MSTHCTGDLVKLFDMYKALLIPVITKPKLSLHIPAESYHFPTLDKYSRVSLSETDRSYYKSTQVLHHCRKLRTLHLSLHSKEHKS